jgi:hypothetical protein
LLLSVTLFAIGLTVVSNYSPIAAMFVRTLFNLALISALTAWTATAGQTRRFCAGFAAAQGSYFLLHEMHFSDVWRGIDSFDWMLQTWVAEVLWLRIRHSDGVTPSEFAETFSLLVGLAVACFAGALSWRYGYAPGPASGHHDG